MTTPPLAQNVKGKGRHYEHPSTKQLVPSITNIIGILNKPALLPWATKLVAEQAAAMKSSLPNLEDDEIVDVLKSSWRRKSSRAADRGTTIHAYLECRLAGIDPPEISGEAARYRKAADAWLSDWNPSVVATEMTVFGQGYAGTGDLWCERDGKFTVVDFKTSKGVYAEAALQLSALGRARFSADSNPLPPAEDAWVVRIGEDGYEAKQVADIDYNYEAFLACLQVWRWMNDGEVYA